MMLLASDVHMIKDLKKMDDGIHMTFSHTDLLFGC